jgi:hypothetical protein
LLTNITDNKEKNKNLITSNAFVQIKQVPINVQNASLLRCCCVLVIIMGKQGQIAQP